MDGAYLITAEDRPGVLYRVSEVIFRRGANIGYIATTGGGHGQVEFQMAVMLIADTAQFDIDKVRGRRF
jgi:uncharacterized protein with ACT and thioredoxin-like domain